MGIIGDGVSFSTTGGSSLLSDLWFSSSIGSSGVKVVVMMVGVGVGVVITMLGLLAVLIGSLTISVTNFFNSLL